MVGNSKRAEGPFLTRIVPMDGSPRGDLGCEVGNASACGGFSGFV